MTNVVAELQDIDNVYRQIEAMILPRKDVHSHWQGHYKPDQRETEQAIHAYHDARVRFQNLYVHLSPNDIIFWFQHGSDLLRRHLAGRMARDFSPLYSDIMVESIRNHHDHSAIMFLQVLIREVPGIGFPLISEALTSPNPMLRATAIDLAGEFQLDQLTNQIRLLVDDPVRVVARAAQRTLMVLT